MGDLEDIKDKLDNIQTILLHVVKMIEGKVVLRLLSNKRTEVNKYLAWYNSPIEKSKRRFSEKGVIKI